jgi:hypothetical protein
LIDKDFRKQRTISATQEITEIQQIKQIQKLKKSQKNVAAAEIKEITEKLEIGKQFGIYRNTKSEKSYNKMFRIMNSRNHRN